jgi:hypothetical protein
VSRKIVEDVKRSKSGDRIYALSPTFATTTMSDTQSDWDLLSSYAGLLGLACVSIYVGSFGSLPVCCPVYHHCSSGVDVSLRIPNQKTVHQGIQKTRKKFLRGYPPQMPGCSQSYATVADTCHFNLTYDLPSRTDRFDGARWTVSNHQLSG